MASPFTAIPTAGATALERLAWLEQVRQQPQDQIVARLYEVERIYSSLPDTALGAVTGCPITTAIKEILDQHAHCSDPCGICGTPHCLPRNAAAKQSLEGLKTSLEGAAEWKKDSDPHLTIVDLAGTDLTTNGKKSALNTVLRNLGEGAMIGALECVDNAGAVVTLFAATGAMPKGIDAAQRIATPNGKPLSPAIPAAGDFLVQSGLPAPLAAFRGIGNPPGACAAQRMLQEALSRGLRPTGLAEMWFGDEKLDGALPRLEGHEYASCPTCKSVLATVLCPNR